MASRISNKLSAKHVDIDRAQLTIVITAGIAAFIVIFCLVASKSLLDQRSYQSKVIDKKEVALKQLKSNASEVKSLEKSFNTFNTNPINILGGNPAGTGDKDGSNGRIVLDALPSKYDFPAVTSSLEKVFGDSGYPLFDITGADDVVAQSQQQITAGAVEIPFTTTIIASGDSSSAAIQLLERSIRPFQIQTIKFKFEENEPPKLTLTGKTFYQAGKSFTIGSEVVQR